MRVLLDTNVVLDLLLGREPFARDAATVVSLVERSRVEGLLCATTVTTIHYLLTRHLPADAARESVRNLLKLFTIAPVNRAVLEEAQRSKICDFEDAVIVSAARLAGADLILTRNQRDFRRAGMPVLGPDEWLAGRSEA